VDIGVGSRDLGCGHWRLVTWFSDVGWTGVAVLAVVCAAWSRGKWTMRGRTAMLHNRESDSAF